MKYIGIGLMWLAIAAAIIGVAFATHNSEATMGLGMFLGIMGGLSTERMTR